MKPTSAKKTENQKAGRAIHFRTTPSYYFHPDEDFKEDYNWERNRMISKTNNENTGKIILR